MENRLQITDNNNFALFDFESIDPLVFLFLHKQHIAISNGSLQWTTTTPSIRTVVCFSEISNIDICSKVNRLNRNQF